MSNKTFDVVLPLAKKDMTVAIKSIPYLFKMLSPRKVVFIGSKDLKSSLPLSKGKVEFIDEDKVYKGMKFSTIQAIMHDIVGHTKRSGWYLQQFLKMAYAKICKNDYYLIWDADTIPLNPISFFDNNNKCLFTMKTEYHKSYFVTLEKLFNGKVKKFVKKSFIAEHMIIDKKIMIELIKKIERNKALKGKYFYEKILYSIDINHIKKQGFSEYETYGNYVFKYHRDKYNMRKLRSLRWRGRKRFGTNPQTSALSKASGEFDLISIEV